MNVGQKMLARMPLDVPMTDAVTLSAIRFPAPTEPAPTVVSLTPYRKEPWATFSDPGLIELGCNVVVADARGLGGSGGSWDGPVSPQEIVDGAHLLEWITEQEWSNGQTALIGPSYLGLNTLLIAAHKPKGLTCIVSIVPPVDLYRDWWYRGGIPSHTNWGAAVGYSNQHRPDAQQRILRDYYLVTMADPFDGERSRSRSAEPVLSKIDAPALIIGGWYDYFLRGTIRAFRGIRSPKRLVVGNWGHGSEAEELRSEMLAWLDFWLNANGEDPSTGTNVVLQTVGSGAWESHTTWPEPADVTWESWQPLEPRSLSRF